MIHTANILVVEDNPDFQELLTTFLSHAGHNVKAADSAGNAVPLGWTWDEETRTVLLDYRSEGKPVTVTGSMENGGN